MSSEAIISGLVLGLVGSFHCAGMCAPLTLALPLHHKSGVSRLIHLLLYQLGRIVTYAIIGFIVGLAGRRIYLQGYQQWFSIGLGAVVLVMVILYFLQQYNFHTPFFKGFYRKVQQLVAYFFQKADKPLGFFAIGMANGLLPCGMVYIALITTLSFGTLWDSIGFMAMFGAGTLPVMMITGLAGQFLSQSVKFTMQRSVPWFVMVVGVLLVLRGLNLGIPFISPALPVAAGEAVVCHP